MSAGTTFSFRSRERGLLAHVFLVVLAGFLMPLAVRLSHAPDLEVEALLPLGVFLVMLVVGHGWLVATGFRGDQVLFPVAMLLAGLGWLAQMRMGTLDLGAGRPLSTWAGPIGLASCLMIVTLGKRGRVLKLEGAAVVGLLLSLGVLGFILVFGQRYRGAIYVAGGMNPAEVVKVFMAVFLAGFLATFRKELSQTVAGLPAPPLKRTVQFLVLWMFPMGLLLVQRDLGMILMLNVVLLGLVVLATRRWGYLVVGLGLAVGLGWVLFTLFPHGQQRFAVWRNPFGDPTGSGWQVLQGLSAMYSGGLWGQGLGSGSPTVIPIAASDFVYAALAEELGFVGSGLLLLGFGVLFYRGFLVADGVKSPFGQSLAAACVLMLAIQTLLNLGGVTKAIPLTGIPLPFLSHGGSSQVTSFALVGLLMALSDGGTASRRGGAGGAKNKSGTSRRTKT
ncbi:MAG TPA: FtsW/RodA/SpoVE family cell cycle protein [Kiritimatiellia bacterium]|nr:FtsW/RodA/SpoVE family cell cycle protein [Kiritimatiellia bacterium]